ncbi:MAG: hypothetical protein A3C07_02020 [Candidatus Sungbacteria bacterium RIFCSPHIGHO2_02_FULL_47_11]|uniref:Uncharacterized protein n=1 Tax=Candidatus Sungbacteria bacterium RIFCSPHIGHO2_02_FULL_47_11 TaxID=1802270 RepID=A0A1G2KQW6_9BACT|nr:MAG: hypothetical protein A3C07_02020 [Candidatus Sungbacteria bacterium RIFCSPHIGHO2_02_FULL_47_11]
MLLKIIAGFLALSLKKVALRTLNLEILKYIPARYGFGRPQASNQLPVTNLAASTVLFSKVGLDPLFKSTFFFLLKRCFPKRGWAMDHL